MTTELAPDTILEDRYVIQRLLGRGGFSNTYLAHDELACRQVVLKELCPPGSSRKEDGSLQLPDAASASAERTTYQFLREAKLLAKLRFPGVIQIFDAFQSAGTVYASTEYFPEGLTLDKSLKSEGPFDVERVRKLLIFVANILDEVHERGYLHRDIKPSNILLLPGDEVVLLDFGAAREWRADATVSHTALFTPGYAPIEQLSESGRRGPATDIYSLAATGYEMLAGIPPASAVDRIGGEPVRDLSAVRSDVPVSLASAILKGLSLRAADRPQSAAEFIELLQQREKTHEDAALPLERMDRALAKLNKLKFRKNECPGCGDFLEQPRPLKPWVCAVCRQGRIKLRELEERRCAICRTGFLKEERNYNPLSRCPICRFGKLEKRGSMFGRKTLHCLGCEAAFDVTGRGEMALARFGKVRSVLVEEGTVGDDADFWLPLGGRSEILLCCDCCGAEWDEHAGGRWSITRAKEDPHGISKKHKLLTLQEWARVAARLPLDAGNYSCDSCAADYFIEGDKITLIDAEQDYFGFVAKYQGRLLDLAQIPWLAVGKVSGEEGLVCAKCQTEFDFSGDYLRLRNTTNRTLTVYVDAARPFDDWHRLARALPARDEEQEFRDNFHDLLRASLISGALAWDTKSACRWASAAQRVTADGNLIAKGEFFVGAETILFDARAKSAEFPLDAIISMGYEEGSLRIRIAGEPEPLFFRLAPMELLVELESGDYQITLSGRDCLDVIESAKEQCAKTARR